MFLVHQKNHTSWRIHAYMRLCERKHYIINILRPPAHLLYIPTLLYIWSIYNGVEEKIHRVLSRMHTGMHRSNRPCMLKLHTVESCRLARAQMNKKSIGTWNYIATVYDSISLYITLLPVLRIEQVYKSDSMNDAEMYDSSSWYCVIIMSTERR